MKFHHRLAFAFLLVPLPACNRPSPDGEDIAVEDEGVMLDLPCGGSDLKTDDLNCGACGNACGVWWPGTQYAAGGCLEGECGPIWTTLFGLPPPPSVYTCEQVCAYGNVACVPRGCSGMTAFVCESIGDFGTQCNLGDPFNHALLEVTGECDEAIPHPYANPDEVEPGTFIDFACCCERP